MCDGIYIRERGCGSTVGDSLVVASIASVTSVVASVVGVMVSIASVTVVVASVVGVVVSIASVTVVVVYGYFLTF